MKRYNKGAVVDMEKLKILQFGETFCVPLWTIFVHKANKDGIYDGKVAIAKSIEFGTLERNS